MEQNKCSVSQNKYEDLITVPAMVNEVEDSSKNEIGENETSSRVDLSQKSEKKTKVRKRPIKSRVSPKFVKRTKSGSDSENEGKCDDEFKSGKQMWICEVCGNSCSNKYILRRHVERHSEPPKGNPTLHCPESDCPESFTHFDKLDIHLVNDHLKIINKEELYFQDEEQFQNWMDELQRKDSTKYLKVGKTYRKSRVLYCHRSSHSQYKRNSRCSAERKRNTRKMGSVKSEKVCTSRIKVDKSGDGLKVTFINTHTGHTINPRLVGLTAPEKRAIADLLLQGVPKRKIMQKFSHTLLNMRDIHNIGMKFKIKYVPDENYVDDEDMGEPIIEQYSHQEELETEPQQNVLPMSITTIVPGNVNLKESWSYFLMACDLVDDEESEKILNDGVKKTLELLKARSKVK